MFTKFVEKHLSNPEQIKSDMIDLQEKLHDMHYVISAYHNFLKRKGILTYGEEMKIMITIENAIKYINNMEVSR